MAPSDNDSGAEGTHSVTDGRVTFKEYLDEASIGVAQNSQDAGSSKNASTLHGWLIVFYLITTDVLGPSTTPWAFSQLGFTLGISLYTLFGACAGFMGWQLWRMFMKLNSRRYPIHTYGDIAFCIYGPWAWHVVNILQSIQLIFCVGVIILGNAQGLSQITNGKVCFSILCLIWASAGMIIGQIQTFQRFSSIAHAAIWMNLTVILVTMIVSAHSAPNYTAAFAQSGVPQGPVQHFTFAPSTVNLPGRVVGLMQAVSSYSGSMIFCEFMSRMKRPHDFWKSLICAQALIFSCYMTFGLFMYARQGQFTINPANQGLSAYNWQTATNVVSLVACLISANLYSNVGIKNMFLYVSRCRAKGAKSAENSGKLLWAASVFGYWSLAFIISSVIPQFSNISGLLAAVGLLQFTYTFPPFLMLGFQIKEDAISTDHLDTDTSRTAKADLWENLNRWKYVIKPRWYIKLLNLLLFLSACVCAILGVYSSIKGIIAGFQGKTVATSFGCRSPVA